MTELSDTLLKQLIRAGYTRRQINSKYTLASHRHKKAYQELNGNIQRILYITDTHDAPGKCKERFKAFARMAHDGGYDRLIHGGDFSDLDSLCTHVPNETHAGRFKGQLMKEFESMNQAMEMMSDNGKLEWVFTTGNHEHRLWDYENRNPEIFGILEDAFLSILRRNNFQFIPYGQYFTIGQVDFVHAVHNGRGKPVGGENFIINIAKKTIRDKVFGHAHKAGWASMPRLGYNEKTSAICGGYAVPQDYIAEYAQRGVQGFNYGVNEITIIDGKIEGYSFIPMRIVMDRYG